MGRVPARIRVKLGDKVTRVASESRNPRGVHYRVGEIRVKTAGLSKFDRRKAVLAAIKELFDSPAE